MAKLDPIYEGLKMVVVLKKRLKITPIIKKLLLIVMLSLVKRGAIYVKKAPQHKHNHIQVCRALCEIKIEQASQLQQHHISSEALRQPLQI